MPTLIITTLQESPTNESECGRGLFKHDTITNKWIKVADYQYEYGYYRFNLVSNGNEIFGMNNGVVYKLVEDDYDTYPSGWKNITAPEQQENTASFVFEDGDCYSHTWTLIGGVGQMLTLDAIGDTLFAVVKTADPAKCNNKFAKFSISSGRWSSVDLPSFPNSGDPDGIVVTDKIAGLFQVFVIDRSGAFQSDWDTLVARDNGFIGATTETLDSDSLTYAYTFDPRTNSWRDISRGPNYTNLTGSDWIPTPTHISTSWDKKKIYMGTERSLYEWQGDRWEYVNDHPGVDIATTNGFLYEGTRRFINANMMRVGPADDYNYPCTPEDGSGDPIDSLWEPSYNNRYDRLATPDDGKTLYARMAYGWSSSAFSCPSGKTTLSTLYESGWNELHVGLYRLSIDPTKPAAVRNLHVEAATYLGGSTGDRGNKPVGVGIGANHQIFVAGNFDGVEGRKHADYTHNTLHGASTSDWGKIMRLNTFADTILSAVTIGDEVHDFEMQPYGELRMVIAGDWGVSVMDSAALTVEWEKDWSYFDGVNTGGALLVDIADNGNVVVMKCPDAYPIGENEGSFYFWIFDKDGNSLCNDNYLYVGQTTFCNNASSDPGDCDVSQLRMNDVSILKDTIFMVGNAQTILDGDIACGETGSLAVQSPFIYAYTLDGSGNWQYLWRTFGKKGGTMGYDQADSRGYRINVGKDNILYFLGEMAGGNSVFRWDGKSVECEPNHPRKIIEYDWYNSPMQTASEHKAYLATIDPQTGYVQRGQMIVPRLSNMDGNSFRVKNGYIYADGKGYVYVGGKSAASYDGREIQFLNGKKIGGYAGGDMTMLIVAPDYMQRTFWGTFSDTLGTGAMVGFGVRDNIICGLGETQFGRMFTGATRVTDPYTGEKEFSFDWAINDGPFYPNYDTDAKDSSNLDAFIAVWYQDVWNHSQDTLEPNPIVSDTIMCDSSFFCEADFKVKEIPVEDYLWDNKETDISVCVNQDITFTDMSTCAVDWDWEFGEGAKVAPYYLVGEANGVGPWTVKYETPGLKDVKLTATINSKDEDCNDVLITDVELKEMYVNVIPDTSLGLFKGPRRFVPGRKLSTKWIIYMAWKSMYGVSLLMQRLLTGRVAIRSVLSLALPTLLLLAYMQNTLAATRLRNPLMYR